MTLPWNLVVNNLKYFTELLKNIFKISFLETVEMIKVEFLRTYVNSFYLLTFSFKISILVILVLLRLACRKYLSEGSFANKPLTEYQIHRAELYNLSENPTSQQVFPLYSLGY